MKYLAAAGASLVLLIGFFVRANLTAIFRSFLHKTDVEDEKKFQKKGLLIVWVVFTIGAFIFVAFFVE
jgi:hypothetical protein